MNCFLSDFKIVRPPFELKQEEAFRWLVRAHTQAEKKIRDLSAEEERVFGESLQARLGHVGCNASRIEKRGHVVPDFFHEEWEKMEVYRLHEEAKGATIDERNAFYDRAVLNILDKFYGEAEAAPERMIHVTCTGYLSPSPMQKFVSQRGWGSKVSIQHAYHMGCYGAFPAIQMGWGSRADIVHTEICSLHTNVARHEADQLVAQSLFADGFIRYRLSPEQKGKGLKILALHEEIIPNSEKAMVWNLSPWGYDLRLGKEIPVLISRALPGFLERMCQKGGVGFFEVKEKARFAVHPGGPKILDYVEEIFDLRKEQLSESRRILKECGNMSSATLPHIWEAMSNEPGLVASFAFGPGLSIHGGLMEVV